VLVIGVGAERVLDVLSLLSRLLRSRVNEFTVVHSDAVDSLLTGCTLERMLFGGKAERIVVRRLRIYISLNNAHSMVGGHTL